jgi:hypothetical protein
MHKVKSTYKVLAAKARERDSIEEWIGWALEMMEAGYETEHLVILAGISPRSNHVNADGIIDKALNELSLDTLTKDETIYGYVYYLIDQALHAKMYTMDVLRILRDVCRDRDYDSELMPFYFLAYAKEDLDSIGEQFYWDGADRGNIDGIVRQQFLDWKARHELIY